jgi:hypothetical protein
MHTNYIKFELLKQLKVVKAATTCFGLFKQLSGSHSQRVAKITLMVPMYLSL